jgi:hypothetical protein
MSAPLLPIHIRKDIVRHLNREERRPEDLKRAAVYGEAAVVVLGADYGGSPTSVSIDVKTGSTHFANRLPPRADATVAAARAVAACMSLGDQPLSGGLDFDCFHPDVVDLLPEIWPELMTRPPVDEECHEGTPLAAVGEAYLKLITATAWRELSRPDVWRNVERIATALLEQGSLSQEHISALLTDSTLH